MAIYTYQELQKKINTIDTFDAYKKICHNIKLIRKQKYKEFKIICNSNTINPYSTENLAALLGYNHTYYKRFESDKDSTKKIPFEKLLIIITVFDITFDDLLK